MKPLARLIRIRLQGGATHNMETAVFRRTGSIRTGLIRAGILAALGACVASCGGEDIHAFSKPLQGGIWHGTDTISGQPVYGIVTEDGAFRFIRDDMAHYAGAATFDKTVVTATFDGFAPPGMVFADGVPHGTGAAAGELTPSDSLNLNTQFLTDAVGATALEGTLNLTFDAAYNSHSSLAAISGTYAAGTDSWTISGNGNVFAQLPGSGCTASGVITIIDEAHNAYAMSITYTGCAGALAVLNDTELTGLVALDSSTTPQRLRGAVSKDDVGIALKLDRT
jgi:hypothetical protein